MKTFSVVLVAFAVACGTKSTSGPTSTGGTSTTGTTGANNAAAALTVNGFTAAVDDAGQVALTWVQTNGATAYVVSRAPVDTASASFGTWTVLTTVSTPGYTDATGDAGTLYAYVVAAKVGDDVGGASLPQLARPTRAIKLTGVAGNHVAYGNGKFVVVGSATAATSTDGVHFTQSASGIFNGVWFVNGFFVTAGNIAGQYRISSDAVTWTDHSVSGAGQGLHGATYGSGTYVLFANSGNGEVWTGSDLTALTQDGVSQVSAVAFSDKFYMGGRDGSIQTSSNGTSWAYVGSAFGEVIGITPPALVWTSAGRVVSEVSPGYWSTNSVGIRDVLHAVVKVDDTVYAGGEQGLWKYEADQAELLADPSASACESLAIGGGRLVAACAGNLFSVAL